MSRRLKALADDNDGNVEYDEWIVDVAVVVDVVVGVIIIFWLRCASSGLRHLAFITSMRRWFPSTKARIVRLPIGKRPCLENDS